jgi:hypothetical protein
VFENVLVQDGQRLSVGEHAIAGMGPASVVTDFMGAAEAWIFGDINSSRYLATLIRLES